MRWAIMAIVLVAGAAVWSLTQAHAAPETLPAAKDEGAMPDDPVSRAYADAVAKAQLTEE